MGCQSPFRKVIPLYKVGCIRVTHPSAGRHQQVLLLIMLPLDLHVLSLPLAFILSQDQTLHCIIFCFPKLYVNFTSLLSLRSSLTSLVSLMSMNLFFPNSSLCLSSLSLRRIGSAKVQTFFNIQNFLLIFSKENIISSKKTNQNHYQNIIIPIIDYAKIIT